MLIPPHRLRDLFGVKPHGVLHVGAHEAEEGPAYRELGWGHVVWVEMLPDKAEELRQRFAGDPDNTVIEAAAWGESGIERDVFRASNNQSSSLYRPETHLTAHPEIGFSQDRITTTRLDEVLDPALSFDFLNLDCQGAEVEAMRGLGARLRDVTWVYLEINVDSLYADIPLRADVDAFMFAHGFTRVAEAIHHQLGWGDALYVNGRRLPPTEVFAMKHTGAGLSMTETGLLLLAGDELVEHLRGMPPG